MRTVCLIVAVVLLMGMAGCGVGNKGYGDLSTQLPTHASVNIQVGEALQNQIVDFGNGVYYFPLVGSDFGNALATFRAAHPDLGQEAMAGDNALGGRGNAVGYFVTFRYK